MAPAPYVTLEALLERVPSLAEFQDGPTGRLSDALIEFSEIVEDYCSVAFAPTNRTYTFTSCTPTRLRPMLRTITSVTADGVALTGDDLPTILDPAAGILRWTTRGHATPLVIVAADGYDEPPKRLQRVAITYVDRTINAEESGVSRDVLSQAVDGATTRYSTPSKKDGRPTGWLEVDRVLNTLPRFGIPGAG